MLRFYANHSDRLDFVQDGFLFHNVLSGFAKQVFAKQEMFCR